MYEDGSYVLVLIVWTLIGLMGTGVIIASMRLARRRRNEPKGPLVMVHGDWDGRTRPGEVHGIFFEPEPLSRMYEVKFGTLSDMPPYAPAGYKPVFPEERMVILPIAPIHMRAAVNDPVPPDVRLEDIRKCEGLGIPEECSGCGEQIDPQNKQIIRIGGEAYCNKFCREE